MKIKTLLLISLHTAATVIAANGQSIISQWTFNSNPADGSTSTGTLTPSTGSGTVSTVGGAVSSFASGSPGDASSAGDNSGLGLTTWPTQGSGSGTAGLQVATSTVGFNNITISLDFRQSGTASRYFQLQASTDGTTFNNVSGGTTSIGTIGSGNTLTSFTSAGLYTDNPGGGTQNFVQSISYSFAPGSAYENDLNFAFRWVAVFDPANNTSYTSANAGTSAAYSTSGTGRFDDVTISGLAPVPEPSTYALVSGGLVALAGFRRRKNRLV